MISIQNVRLCIIRFPYVPNITFICKHSLIITAITLIFTICTFSGVTENCKNSTYGFWFRRHPRATPSCAAQPRATERRHTSALLALAHPSAPFAFVPRRSIRYTTAPFILHLHPIPKLYSLLNLQPNIDAQRLRLSELHRLLHEVRLQTHSPTHHGQRSSTTFESLRLRLI